MIAFDENPTYVDCGYKITASQRKPTAANHNDA